MLVLARRTLDLRRHLPTKIALIAFCLGSIMAPSADSSALSPMPWQKVDARVRLLSVQSSSRGLSAWCELEKVFDLQGHELSALQGKKTSIALDRTMKAIPSLRFNVQGSLKVSHQAKVRLKITHLEPVENSSWKATAQLAMLNFSLKWRAMIHALSQERKQGPESAHTSAADTSAMGRSLLTSMLGAGQASARVDYILQRLGLAHLTAISGLHFALVSLLIAGLLRRLYMPWRLLASALLSFAFLIACTPSASSLRAWLMSLIATGCLLTMHRYRAIHALSLSALVWLIIYPTWAWQIGFVLSVYCTAILIAISPLLTSKEASSSLWERWIQPWLALQGAMFFFTSPFFLYWFHTVSWLSIVANLTLAPLFAFAFWLALLGVLLCFFAPTLASWYLGIVYTLSDWLLQLLADLPHRLDQPWNLELSPLALACLLPWMMMLLFKLLESQLDGKDEKSSLHPRPSS